ncbi:MAG: cytochrome c biogenesis heme-transporting ATPase CcmA [Gammaproteobacteria bacterium]|nr:cytochrome c biogenesis heme-transporting ATPase CcmA [Gammaproteobacteria bacterium]MBU1444351.1 cytochrome c biogenesis heme-transporting ATPase CcmA [Gammaproteobacteria bacterium]MBU2410916.1 cytochrome c biogenesis heme-transporting ATPase CcmA [Gammaproteobacteria bacterium]
MAIPALELRNLRCVRGGRSLFEGLNLRVPAGRALHVSGANGSGKTSLLRMVCGLLMPTDGEVLWRGQRAGHRNEAMARELVYLGHAAGLKDELSAEENLLAATRLAGRPVASQDAVDALSASGLRGQEDVAVRRLSQGQRKRVSLAQLLLARSSSLWVLDEPFNALDASASAWLRALIASQVASGGVVLLTDHQDHPLPPAVAQLAVSL